MGSRAGLASGNHRHRALTYLAGTAKPETMLEGVVLNELGAGGLSPWIELLALHGIAVEER